MNCPRCGATAPAGARQCPICRESLTDFAPTVAFDTSTLSQYADGGATVVGGAPTTPIPPAVTGFGAVPMTPIPPSSATGFEGSAALGDGRLPLEPGQAFGSRYHIIRLLGAGGMGAVYQAWDAELGVAVAIKVIRPEAMADQTIAADIERRFKRELLLARQVTHKNVVRIHDIGQIDGIKYITMSYVDGVDLSTAVKTEGRLPIAKVLQTARSAASGLAAAHAAGVVHRDLKPANIMLQADGTALIMDFGIARSTGDSKSPARTGAMPKLSLGPGAKGVEATMAGVIVGTVEYMAPEQARGEAVDQRADVYAFGLILYDLLTGRSRVHPNGAIAELQARMQQAPPVLKTLVPEVPEALSRLVMRCVDPNPAARFSSAADIVTELDLLDDRGELIPVRRTVRMPLVLAMVAALLGLSVASYWLSPGTPPAAAHDPVTVLIADIQNNTGDPAFDGALEPTLRRALESASFISATERARINGVFGVAAPVILDEANALAFAAKQGVGVVLSGAIDRRGSGYEVSVRAIQGVTGEVVTNTKGRASSKEQVLDVVTRLVSTVRKALGDETSDSAQMFAMRSISTTSFDVVRLYAAALQAQSDGKYEDARQSALKAVELDSKFGMGYALLGGMSRNLGNLQDAEKYSSQALSYLDGMTERERFATRGFYYRMTGDHQQCVKEYGDMTAQFPADVGAHNQRALCLSKLRRMRESVQEIRQAVQILPKRVFFRGNLAVYAAYAGDYQVAEQEVRAVEEPNDLVILALAYAQLGQGLTTEATATFETLRAMSPRGASWAASGLAHLALYEGRVSAAVKILEEGVDSDLKSKNGGDRAARKLTSLAFAHLQRGRHGDAIAAAEKALQNSNAMEVRFLAARIFIEANALDRARGLATELASALPAEPQAYGKILEGEIALKSGDARQAIKILSDANSVLETWFGHFALGRAYLEAGALPQADSEFDRCIQRRGEALSLLVDEEPTYGYFPIVYYYQGRVREGLKNAGFADSYREYLRIRGASKEDPLLPEVRKRVGG